MPRHLLVAGIDFGTSYTKVVIRNQNTLEPAVVEYESGPGVAKHDAGLIPSLVGIQDNSLHPPDSMADCETIQYLKMLAADVASGTSLSGSQVQMPECARRMADVTELVLIQGYLAYYLTHVIHTVEEFVARQSPWQNFDFQRSKHEDFLIYQLAVPTGLYAKKGNTDRFFEDALLAARLLKDRYPPEQLTGIDRRCWIKAVRGVLQKEASDELRKARQLCCIYPEVAAAVQTFFRSPNASDGLYITVDVGAGTVDLNAFRRHTRPETDDDPGSRLNYYAARVAALGIRHIQDAGVSERLSVEGELMRVFRREMKVLFKKACEKQPQRAIGLHGPWQDAQLFIFGGGSHYPSYRENFAAGLSSARDGIKNPTVKSLPLPPDLDGLSHSDFGRFVVAYGLSFMRVNLDSVRLPHELRDFYELHPDLKPTGGEDDWGSFNLPARKANKSSEPRATSIPRHQPQAKPVKTPKMLVVLAHDEAACPVCGVRVKKKRLQKHLKKHPAEPGRTVEFSIGSTSLSSLLNALKSSSAKKLPRPGKKTKGTK